MQIVQQRRSLAPDLARGFMLLLIAMAYTDAQLSDWLEVLPVTEAQNGNIFEKTAVFIKTLFRGQQGLPDVCLPVWLREYVAVSENGTKRFRQKEDFKAISFKGILVACFRFFHSVLVFNYEILAPYGIALLITAPLLFNLMTS